MHARYIASVPFVISSSCTERGSNVVQRTVMSLDAQREVQMWYRGSNVVQRTVTRIPHLEPGTAVRFMSLGLCSSWLVDLR